MNIYLYIFCMNSTIVNILIHVLFFSRPFECFRNHNAFPKNKDSGITTILLSWLRKLMIVLYLINIFYLNYLKMSQQHPLQLFFFPQLKIRTGFTSTIWLCLFCTFNLEQSLPHISFPS